MANHRGSVDYLRQNVREPIKQEETMKATLELDDQTLTITVIPENDEEAETLERADKAHVTWHFNDCDMLYSIIPL